MVLSGAGVVKHPARRPWPDTSPGQGLLFGSLPGTVKNASGRKPMAQDSETEPDLIGRIIAIERLVKYALWNLIAQRVDEAGGGDTEAIEEVRRLREDVTEILKVSSFRGIYPALSAPMVALVDDHVDRILRELTEEMEERLGDTR
jgi:hypothetical protein